MKTLVTGGSGFIGSHVVDALIDNGAEIVVLDSGVQPHRTDVGFADCDVGDYDAVRAAVEGCRYVFHLAAVSNVNHAFDDPLKCVRLNIQGTANVLEAARQSAVERVFFASTVWIYSGAGGSEVNEESPFFIPDAGHVYTSSKIAGELLCHDYLRLYGQKFTVLRYGIPYGPRMRDTLVIPIFIRKALGGEPLTIMGEGTQYRNFVYVEDLARAHVLALDPRAENQIYNLEGIQRITVREVAETVRRFVGEHVEIVRQPARPGDYAGKEVSAEKARVQLGWTPTVGFEDGMRLTVEWYREKLAAEAAAG